MFHRARGISDSQADAEAAGPPVTAEREAYLLPHAPLHAASQRRAAARAIQPTSLTGYINWVRWAYRQEPPFRLHTRGLADDGTPRLSGDFAAWLAGADSDAACLEDGDGYYRTPLRCALYRMHGKNEDAMPARQADFLMSVAQSDWAVADVAELHHISPAWTQAIVAEVSLRDLWEIYSPLPR